MTRYPGHPTRATNLEKTQSQRPKGEGVAAVDRALSIVAAFESASEPLTISELSRRTGLYKSTALRLLESLRKFGYVSQTSNNRYELGPTLLRLGTLYQQNNRLQERLLPIFERIVAAGSESPSFFIRQGTDERLCIFRLDSNHSTLDRVRAGLILPLDRGAAGHVIRAFDDRAKGAKFEKIRADGYAVSFGETSPDCAAVAAPIFDESSDLVGALSISGPRSRFTDETISKQIEYLDDAASSLCLTFGGRYPR